MPQLKMYILMKVHIIDQEKSDLPLLDRNTFIEKNIEKLKDIGLSDLEKEIAEEQKKMFEQLKQESDDQPADDLHYYRSYPQYYY